MLSVVSSLITAIVEFQCFAHDCYSLELPHECELCGRRFKNLPALNGHMRLHGGYFKKVVLNIVMIVVCAVLLVSF
jgi:hypothetical protein